MDQADAVKKWKKDKPLLLTDTGVSDELRKLPEDWTKPIDVSAVKVVLKKLKEMMADKKISESKSATACLTAIRKEVLESVTRVENQREKAIEILKDVHGLAKSIYAMCESKKVGIKKLKAYPGDLAKFQKNADQLLARGQDSSAVPAKIMQVFRLSMESTVKTSKTMADLVEDALSEKPKQDIKKEFPGLMKEFKASMDEMPSAWEAIERLT